MIEINCSEDLEFRGECFDCDAAAADGRKMALGIRLTAPTPRPSS